jgi:histidyl-tRNA synthetase
MSLSTQPYKGARDFYPDDKRLQKYMFWILRSVVERFGYQEYDAPVLESFDIYAAKSGQELVNDQLYWFEDRGGRKVAIRPEMTPTLSRMVAAKRQELAYPLRLYSIPNLWRYERPQRGRLREHWQLNVDLIGADGLTADAEIIQIADTVLKAFGSDPVHYRININSRQAMIAAMKEFELEEDELKRAYQIVDKMPKISDDEFEKLLVEHLSEPKAKKLLTYLKSENPPDNVKTLLKILASSGVKAYYEPSVVRGLEYYTDIVFEVFATHPELNRAMFGGGRYDGLVEMFGAQSVPMVGFGMGDVMLLEFLQTHKLMPELLPETHAVVILIGDVYDQAQPIIGELRAAGLNLAVDSTDRKMDAKIKSAAKSGVERALFIGEDEIKSGQLKLRNLAAGQDEQLSLQQVVENLIAR